MRAGEKVPADGVVREGTSWVDLSMLTGESVPVDVGPGDEVVGASINGHGRLVVFVTKVGANTRLAEIVRLLEAAQGVEGADPTARRPDLGGVRPGRPRRGGADLGRVDRRRGATRGGRRCCTRPRWS